MDGNLVAVTFYDINKRFLLLFLQRVAVQQFKLLLVLVVNFFQMRGDNHLLVVNGMATPINLNLLRSIAEGSIRRAIQYLFAMNCLNFHRSLQVEICSFEQLLVNEFDVAVRARGGRIGVVAQLHIGRHCVAERGWLRWQLGLSVQDHAIVEAPRLNAELVEEEAQHAQILDTLPSQLVNLLLNLHFAR